METITNGFRYGFDSNVRELMKKYSNSRFPEKSQIHLANVPSPLRGERVRVRGFRIFDFEECPIDPHPGPLPSDGRGRTPPNFKYLWRAIRFLSGRQFTA